MGGFLEDFDPATGDPLGDQHSGAFPDADALIAELDAERGRVPRDYCVARVPDTDVYILYAVEHATHTIGVMAIRTYSKANN